ncbi:MAG: copper resistance protein NlpE [Spirochaetaceae bacterium]|jgi:uncharacterized lipoprotein NlpE involved in copper resistance|nr:copper resistance protein NlpE [Spirochaetaceae bacterium]
MKKTIVTVITVCFLLGACASTDTTVAKNATGWAGVYAGTTPGADSAIRVVLTLRSDRTYSLTWQYIDKSSDTFTAQGGFTWNKAGDTIMLDAGDWPPYYLIGQGFVTQLDMSGQKITGELADQYVLKLVQ